MSVWKLYAKKIVLVLVVIIVFVGSGIIILESNNEQNKSQSSLEYTNKYEEFVDECSSGEYEKAIQLTENLREPYKSYYKDYVTYAMKIDGWVGTEQELYAWLEDYFKFEDISKYAKTEFPSKMGNQIQVWKDVHDAKAEFDKNKEYFLDAFEWQPKYNQIVKTYYTEMYNYMWQNREFFKNDVVDGRVYIPYSNCIELDEKAFDTYKKAIKDFEDLQSSYKLNDDFKTLFRDELAMIERVYEAYSEYTITAMVTQEYSAGEVVIYSEEGAKNNYEILTNYYSINALNLTEEDHDRGWLWQIFSDEELPEHIKDISAAGFDLYSIVKRCYPGVEIEIVESELVDNGKIFDEIFLVDTQ